MKNQKLASQVLRVGAEGVGLLLQDDIKMAKNDRLLSD